ncbi:MAG: fumarylacetoacetase [Flavobacteriales bacterium]|nr:fumarylacetoacetase [Flavobacteriales bacterium]
MSDFNANNPANESWLEISKDSDFSIQNIPFGIIKRKNGNISVASRLGEQAIDLNALFEAGLLNGLGFDASDFSSHSLNSMMIKGKKASRALRNRIAELFSKENNEIQGNDELIKRVLVAVSEVENLMPVEIGDYTDFYSSIEHATNVGTMFRDPNNALLPNWKYIPVGYHGRASSIILSGEEIHRPKGQQKPKDDEPPVFGPCKLLDFELEMAFITYDGKPLGKSISTAEAEDYIFGMVLFNDWSARDIQKWEYVPLGPFLAKNFASSISAWIVTLDALEPFRVAGPEQDPKVFPYLEYKGDKNIDINLEVYIQPEGSTESKICSSNYKYMYWNQNQQLAHHTINGCNINAGDMYASGTISGKDKSSYGSMLELSWKGTQPLTLDDGSERKFIQDGDTVVMKGFSTKDGVRVGFGEVRTKVKPAV